MGDWLQILLGLVLLVGGADLMVRGAVWVALTLGIRPMTIGLTVVAFGTSAPELVASLAAASRDGAAIATGTVLGSNLANLLLILGLVAVVRPIRNLTARVAFESNYLVLMTVLTAMPFLFGGRLGPSMGTGLFALVAWFTWQLAVRERRGATRQRPPVPRGGRRTAVLHVGFLIAGGLGLNYGGGWLIEGAKSVALQFGMSDVLVGMTVVAIGTSMPELAASVVAAQRGHPEICLGNIIGSNIFNIGMVWGLTAIIHPLPVSWASEGPLMVAGVVAMAAVVLLLRTCHGLPRMAGPFMLLGYTAVLTYEALR